MMDMRAAAATNGKRLGADTRHVHIKLRNNDEGRLEYQAAFATHDSTSRYFLLRICASI